MNLLSRLLERVGLVADTDVRDDPDEYIPPTPIEHLDQYMPKARAQRIADGDEPCPHLRETPLLPTAAGADKLYRCDDCGTVYRHVLVPGRPWLIGGYQKIGTAR